MQKEDSYRHQGMRRRMVDELEATGRFDPKVLEVMAKIPRHLFVDTAFTEFAYEDRAFPIAAGQTISHPSTVAAQSSLLQLEPGMKVLEIGTGSGYQAAVLAEMGVKLYSIERQRLLYKVTKPLLTSLGYRAKYYYGDGFIGRPQEAPFERIIVTCGAPYIPTPLTQQLVIGGRMIIPVGQGDEQRMQLLVKNGPEDFELTEHGIFSFVPMLQDKSHSSNTLKSNAQC